MSGHDTTAADRKAGTVTVLFRFLTGQHLDGRRRTEDGTFWQRGTAAVEPHWFGRGRASRWAMLAGWQRAAVRWAAALLAIGWWRWRTDTEWTAACILGPAAGLGIWRTHRALLMRRHVRTVVRPLAAALAPALEASPVEVERTLWVPRGPELEHRTAEVTAALPHHHQGMTAQTDAVARIIGQRLGGEWQARIARDPLAVVAIRRPEPPRRVTFADVADLIREHGSATRPLMGLGADHDPAWLDFGSEIAHQGVSVGTGGGKSAYLRYLIAQFAYFGCADFPIIDGKLVSLAGMEAVPGLRVYREVHEQWAALAALRKDMEARYTRLLADPAATFPLCVCLLEEQNDFAIESRAYWRQIKDPRDPMTPPVYDDITRLLIKGRQVGYRVIGVYQRLSAAACGGIDAGVMRDAYGSKALARFSPQAWDALTGIRPRSHSSVIEGRWVLVQGNVVRAVQVPYGEPGELAAFALSAPVPGVVPVPVREAAFALAGANVPGDNGAGCATTACHYGGRSGTASGTAPGLVVGLADAADVLAMTVHGFKKARQRKPIDGERIHEGRPAWRPSDLAAWRGGAS
jgi:hypothetical protein